MNGIAVLERAVARERVRAERAETLRRWELAEGILARRAARLAALRDAGRLVTVRGVRGTAERLAARLHPDATDGGWNRDVALGDLLAGLRQPQYRVTVDRG